MDGHSSKEQRLSPTQDQRPFMITLIASLWFIGAIALLPGAILWLLYGKAGGMSSWQVLTAATLLMGVFTVLGWGLWTLQDWARIAVSLLCSLALCYVTVMVVFSAAALIFGGEHITPWSEIVSILGRSLLRLALLGALPGSIIFVLQTLNSYFAETWTQRVFTDRLIYSLLVVSALSAIAIVLLIFVFTAAESRSAVTEIGIKTMLLGTVWRPGSIIGGAGAQYGLVPMVVGSLLSTVGAIVLGVPISVGTAVLLAEIAPPSIREVLRRAVELLAGVPSVVYGLFGMVVLAPLIRTIDIPYNTGYGLLNASIILAVMIIPTVTNIAEDAIRTVPAAYKEGSLALGTTQWETIANVILPAARSGIIAAVILGIGRALGETMALIMVIGNAIALPTPLNDNVLTIFLSPARTLTGNIAVEINYAAGTHRSALFFTGVLLFIMLLLVNTVARYLMQGRLKGQTPL